MTREEAINQLQDAKDGYKEYLTDEALDMAIEALEQEPTYTSQIAQKAYEDGKKDGYVQAKLKQEPTIQERQAKSDKFDAAFQDGYNNGYAQAKFDYEQEAYNKGYEDGVKSINICPYCGEYIGEEE